jgi:ParB family transcriptional regulator, chromosome partitioning protein
VIDRQAQPGEQVQQLPDEQIEDSPYQARQPFSDASVEDLAQGMREAGFQGVLIVRLHGDPAKRRRGLVQLVYGHRRRAAWRQICAELGQPCQLPVVVRDISDAQMLTIGAQENLQRQDLDPMEEAQIVAWHEQVFFDKNQVQLGAMLGKSSDWVSVRSRIHKLPDVLKERLRDRPRAIAQILELGSLYTQQPEVALTLADRVVHENLTLDAIRSLMRGYARPEARDASRIGSAKRRGAATKVQEITKRPVTEHNKNDNSQSTAIDFQDAPGRRDVSEPPQGQSDLPAVTVGEFSLPANSRMPAVNDEALLQQATETLTILASHAERLLINEFTGQLRDQLETALSILRQAFGDRTSGQSK